MKLPYGKQDSYIQNKLPLFDFAERQSLQETLQRRYGHLARRCNVSLTMAAVIAGAANLKGVQHG